MSSCTKLPSDIAIIGAGIAGLTLALSLHLHGVQCTVYEMRSPTHRTPGPVMLAPNALRILDRLGVYARIRSLGFHLEGITFSQTVPKSDSPQEGLNVTSSENLKVKKTNDWLVGHKKMYDYPALRVMRQSVLSVLRSMVNEQGITIMYNKRFESIIAETPSGVTFAFQDGDIQCSKMLIGADGIWSRVRSYVVPNPSDAEPTWSGGLAITATVKAENIDWPSEEIDGGAWKLPLILTSSAGATLMVPYSLDGKLIQIGRQWPWEAQKKDGWKELAENKTILFEYMQKDMDMWPIPIQQALKRLDKDSLVIWPYYSLPKLERWISPKARVVIVGDAAHAVPPMAGQGGCQAIEDAFSFARTIAPWLTQGKSCPVKIDGGKGLLESMTAWQGDRYDKVARVVQLTKDLNALRLPLEEREKLGLSEEFWRDVMGRNGELMWLYRDGTVNGQSK